ncbi:endonuclease/exonuclease/phosphatase family domain-containing protein 1-like [Parasteatoda tepidariorum]|uniref:endonuclease/exonuclease/phosphatase family domain-containing protein 1-like n=1 Tax=Parasteatoda tepidariorum TaxID=114398 RepID=UPI0039BC6402
MNIKVVNNENESSKSDEDSDDENQHIKISHTDGLKANESAIEYIEYRGEATPTFLLSLRKWETLQQKSAKVIFLIYLFVFKVKGIDFVVISFSLVSETYVAKLLPSILEQLKEKIQGKKNIFLVGDFILPPGHTVFEVLSSQGYTSLVPVETSLNDSLWQEESHIWSSLNIRKYFTGRSGVVVNGLSHLAIPDGWKWGGIVSKHCPIWAEIFTEEESNNSNVKPLLNGVSKTPLIHTDLMPNSHSEDTMTLDSYDKERCKGFWGSSWPWRHHKQRLISETKNAISMENGSL